MKLIKPRHRQQHTHDTQHGINARIQAHVFSRYNYSWN